MPEPTDAEKQRITDENARASAVSIRWMTRNLHRYKPDNRTAQLIGDYVLKHKLAWTEESIDAAFDALVAAGEIEEQENSNDTPPNPPPAPTAADPNAPPWLAAGYSNPLGKSDIRRMRVPEMKAFLRDKRFGTLFEQQIRDLKVTNKGELRQ